MTSMTISADRGIPLAPKCRTTVNAFLVYLRDFLMAATAGIGNIQSEDPTLRIQGIKKIMGSVAIRTEGGFQIALKKLFSMNRQAVGAYGILH